MAVKFINCINSYISAGHLTDPVPVWECSGRFLAHHKLDIENISSINGRMTSKAAGGWQHPIGDFRHSRYQKLFPFFNFLNWYNTLCLEIQGYLSGDKLSPSHLSHSRNSSQCSHPIYRSHPNVSQSS